MLSYKRFILGLFSASCIFVAGGMAAPATAQEIDGMMEEDIMGMPAEEAPVPVVKLPKVPASEIPSLFWEEDELSIIRQVKKGVIQIMPVDEGLLNDTMFNMPTTTTAPKQFYIAPREILLSGLLYNSEGDWVVWLNGMRVTPQKKPDELRYINVKEQYVELKWYDAVTDKVYPIRIKPHQKFSIDLQTFLPG